MVEHIWIRLAELKEDAANEEWALKHPRLARANRLLHYYVVQAKIFRKWCGEQQAVIKMILHLRAWQEQCARRLLFIYLMISRWYDFQPRRHLVSVLSTKELIAELTLRGIDHSACVERIDLLDALCGPAIDSSMGGPEHTTMDDMPATLDKMV